MEVEADSKSESDASKTFLGTTKKGIGPTYASKANRYGLRVGDLKNWELFQYKFKYMHKIFREKEK
jgi:adenylosuccinate synthase